MDYRKHDGLRISEVGVGCYALSGAYGSVDIEDFKRMILRAHELGVNFFDTAEGYGEAERILGEAVRPFREEIHIATKVGIREGIEPDLSKEYISDACERSLRQLDTDYIDLYQVHFDDPQTPVSETVESLDRLVAEGKIRQYGIGHLPVDRVKEYCERGSPFSILMELSAVARESREELLPFCATYDMAGIGFSTTGRGILTGKYGPGTQFEPGDIRNFDPVFQGPRFDSALRIQDAFSELAERYGVTTAQMAIAWVLAQPGILCALTGSSKIKHLEENVGASGVTIKKVDLEHLEDLFAGEETLLKEREKKRVHEIVNASLPTDPQQAFTDLVYALETSVNLRLLPEDTVRPVFVDLWPLRESLDRSLLPSLLGIQKKLKDLLE
ncbi:aldo/keto reductase [Candidatus Thorarchaeota archaeon]|nr:MAG: aldo/keto reductase [Candidatus Thorarchaeota archaeon]